MNGMKLIMCDCNKYCACNNETFMGNYDSVHVAHKSKLAFSWPELLLGVATDITRHVACLRGTNPYHY